MSYITLLPILNILLNDVICILVFKTFHACFECLCLLLWSLLSFNSKVREWNSSFLSFLVFKGISSRTLFHFQLSFRSRCSFFYDSVFSSSQLQIKLRFWKQDKETFFSHFPDKTVQYTYTRLFPWIDSHSNIQSDDSCGTDFEWHSHLHSSFLLPNTQA